MTAYACPYCDGETEEIYRCTECGKDLAGTRLTPAGGDG